MDIKSFVKAHAFAIVAGVIAALAILLLTFQAGVSVGFSKADFNCRWSENYHRNFGGPPPGGMMGFIDQDESVQAHGVFGRVIDTATDSLVVKQSDGVEKVVLVGDDTVIQLLRSHVRLSEVHVNEMAVVIGTPNDQGQIMATFIRLMPPLPSSPSATSTSATR